MDSRSFWVREASAVKKHRGEKWFEGRGGKWNSGFSSLRRVESVVTTEKIGIFRASPLAD